MLKTGKYRPSYDTAQKTLARFFSGSTDTNRVTPQQIYVAVGREHHGAQQNMYWLSNRLTDLRYYNLVHPRYASSYGEKGSTRLLHIELTEAGRTALGRQADGVVSEAKKPSIRAVAITDVDETEVPSPARPASSTSAERSPSLTLETVAAYLAHWQRDNPSFEVRLTISLKDTREREIALWQ